MGSLQLIKTKKYQYGEHYVFSIFDFMGHLILAKMLSNKNIPLPKESEITVEDVSEDSFKLSENFHYLNLRNLAIEGIEGHSTFKVVYNKEIKLLQQAIKIVAGTKQNLIQKRFSFRSAGVYLETTIKKPKSSQIEYLGILLDGTTWVDHLHAKGMSRPMAIEIVSIAVKSIANILNTRYEKPV